MCERGRPKLKVEFHCFTALDEVKVRHFVAEHDEVEGGHQVELARRRVDRVELLDGVRGAADSTDLPVDLALHGHDVEEHVHVRQVRGHRQRRHAQLVLDVDGRPALDGEVEHANVVEDHLSGRSGVEWGKTSPQKATCFQFQNIQSDLKLKIATSPDNSKGN